MNKLSKLSLLLILTSFTSFAQKAQLQSAMNYVKWGDLDKAKEAIDQCTTNESTIGMAKTWYWSGFIYQSIAESKEEKFANLKQGALDQALKSYKKTIELDATSNDYTDDIKSKIGSIAYNYMDQGINAFQEKKYDDALTNFAIGVQIKKEFFNKTDTSGINNCALAASKAGKYQQAALYYTQVIDLNAGDSKTFISLSNAYLNQNDTIAALKALGKGITKYPQDKDLASRQFNLYLISGKANEAYTEVEKSIQLDPSNANLYLNKGILAEQLNKPADAEIAYKKAIELNPGLFDAQYNMGIFYYNQGVELNKKANDIKDNAKYEAVKKQFDAKFALALPYLEKAFEINRKDTGVLLSLKTLYSRAGNQDKVTMINKAIEDAKK
ncbi:MAG: tetratricopeptide repeat protein [Bacteroidota bacterium]